MKRLFLACAILCSCTKVINVTTPNASAQLVIEGSVTNGPGPYTVAINTTVPFSVDNNFPGADGAMVTITDNTGLYDSLVESSSGVYTTQGSWQGQPGNTYTMHVRYNGGSYVASSTMPQQVNLDSVTFTQQSSFRKAVIKSVMNFQDPAGVKNYYQFAETINGVPYSRIYVDDDRLSDGKYIRLALDDSAHLKVGDDVMVNMYCIDQNAFNYFRGLAQQQGGAGVGAGFNSVAPANPPSNISGGVLGNFSAHTIQTEGGIVPNF